MPARNLQERPFHMSGVSAKNIYCDVTLLNIIKIVGDGVFDVPQHCANFCNVGANSVRPRLPQTHADAQCEVVVCKQKPQCPYRVDFCDSAWLIWHFSS